MENSYALTPLQQGMLFHSILARDSGVDVLQLVVEFDEALKVELFRQAWEAVVARHEVLRTCFFWECLEEPRQVFQSILPLPWSFQKVGEVEPLRREEMLTHFLNEDRRAGFDVATGPLFRLALFQYSPAEFRLVWTFHHALMDDRAFELVVREVFTTYEAAVKGEPVTLPEVRPYRDYLEWLAKVDVLSSESYWKRTLQGFTEPTKLVLDSSRAIDPRKETRQGDQETSICKATTELLEQITDRIQVRMETLIYGIWGLLLSRYNDCEDVVFGATLSTRSHSIPGVESMVGLFWNTLPFRVLIDREASFETWLRGLNVQRESLSVHVHTPLVNTQAWSEVSAGAALFESLVDFEPCHLDTTLRAQGGNWSMRRFRPYGQPNFPLTFAVYGGEELSLKIEFNRERFDDATISRMLGHLCVMIESIAKNPAQRLGDIPLLTDSEKKLLLSEWNDTHVDFQNGKTLYELFETQASKTPEVVAVAFKDLSLTYNELDRRADQLAAHLQSLGEGVDELVGLCLDRSLEMPVAMLAVLKAGAAYVPIDPSYPADRVAFMLEDAGATIVLTSTHVASALSFPKSTKVIALDAFDWSLDDEQRPILRRTTKDHAAYVIYTSGSTGCPKGVVISHGAIVNHMQWMQSTFPLGGGDRVLQKTPFSFDASIWEFYAPLLSGATLVLAEPGGHMDPTYLVEAIIAHQITILQLVPSMLEVLLDVPAFLQCHSLHRVFCGGEALTAELVKRFFASSPAELHNLYGPTEVTIDSVFFSSNRDVNLNAIPIGRPVANTRAYILDRQQRLLPIGASGELYLGGAQVARGYHRQPSLTDASFLRDPFVSGPEERMFRTGDRARYRADGNIEFLGRLDEQVKVRGFRIELGEIEFALRQQPEVRQCVVLAHGDDFKNKRLVAYLVTQEAGLILDFEDLAKALKATLPDYMVPAVFMMVAELPLTPSGKINRKALPAPDFSKMPATKGFLSPRTPIEELIAGVWQEVLKLQQIGIHDHFFTNGGHSILATQAVLRLRRALDLEFPLAAIFEFPTVAELAHFLVSVQNKHSTSLPRIVPLDRDKPLVMSFAQRRLWFLDRYEGKSNEYHIIEAVTLRGGLDRQALGHSIKALKDRHESLRTVFTEKEGTPEQVILSSRESNLEFINLTNLKAPQQKEEITKAIRNEQLDPFDLGKGPLLRLKLIQLGEQEHLLLWTIHHIISDGWSRGVFNLELAQLYKAFSQGSESALRPLPIQYADYAHWQREWLKGDQLEKQSAYWHQQLEGIQVLDLPTDRSRPALQSFVGACHRVRLPAELIARMEAFNRLENATAFMTLLATFQTLLARYAGQDDVTVGVPIANRQQVELEQLIGFFANTLVLRTELSGEPSFKELVSRVRKRSLEAFQYQDMPFEKLVEELNPLRDLSRHPLFQVLFALQNAPVQPLHLEGIEVTDFEFPIATTHFDLELHLQPDGASWIASFIYNIELFEAATIERMAGHFVILLDQFLAKPDGKVFEVSLWTAEEDRELNEMQDDTLRSYPESKCLHELFEEQVLRTPEAVALVFEEAQWSYRELNERADSLAEHLSDLGIGADMLVGLCLQRSPEMVLSTLAIMKAGGAYLPLDPHFPASRLKMIIEDAAPSVLIAEQSLAHLVEGFQGHIIWLNEWNWNSAAHSRRGLSSPSNLAYVIYTSGSTGRPKGVELEHRSVVNFLLSMKEKPGLNSEDVLLAVTTISFDISVLELFLPLIVGARVVIAPEETRMDGAALSNLLDQCGATVFQATPATWKLLINSGWMGNRNLKALVGGEALPRSLASELRTRCGSLWNLYGPTETTVWSLLTQVEDHTRITIGKPIANTQVYLVDRAFNRVPIGVAGELLIGGHGLARGYRGQPELTAEKFIDKPFTNGGRLYRTGDSARCLADGKIEFLGRLDHQVKIRGFRIELGEIESVLSSHPEVKECVTIIREDTPDDPRLVAYIVPKLVTDGAITDAKTIEQWQVIWNETYSQADADVDPRKNFIGWKSSYTGEAMPKEHLQASFDFTIERVLALKPKKVLEIGCGSGLLLSRIVSHVESYLGTDLSATTLDRLKQSSVLADDLRARITLRQQAANDFTHLSEAGVDTVIINSVAQYFPNLDYLMEVLAGVVSLLPVGGKIFLGDLRSLPLLEVFHTGVELAQAKDETSLKDLQRRVRRRSEKESELLIAPAFFNVIHECIPAISRATVSLKRGRHHDEVTHYRYDVVIEVGARVEVELEPIEHIHWEGFSMLQLREYLQNNQPKALRISGVPNARLTHELEAHRIMHSSNQELTVKDLKEHVQLMSIEGYEPDDFWALETDYPYTVELDWSEYEGGGSFDVLMSHRDNRTSFRPHKSASNAKEKPLDAFANKPYSGDSYDRLIPQLRGLAISKLPEPMVPSSFVILEVLPLTPNGKTDRKALPPPDDLRPSLAQDFVAPRNETETLIAACWSRVLGVDRVGIHDDFFALGGHSLKALRLINEVNSSTGIALAVIDFFKAPTVAGMAAKAAPEVITSEKHDIIGGFLIPLKSDGPEPPLFIIPGGWGGENEMLVFATLLPGLKANGPVYAVLSRALDASWQLPASVTDQAMAILSVIRQIQPKGPYLLLGECIGGVLAMEIAKLIEHDKGLFNTVILLDSRPPEPKPLFGFNWLWKARVDQSKPAKDTATNLPVQIDQYYKLLASWSPKKIRSNVHLILSSEISRFDAFVQGWRRLTKGRFTTQTVKGSHDSYIREDSADLVRAVNEVLLNLRNTK